MDVENGALRLRITDFGISRIEQIYTNSASYMAKGAGRWMAPEILMPSESQSGRPTEKSDVYAYAMTCIEVLRHSRYFQILLTPVHYRYSPVMHHFKDYHVANR